MDAVGKAKDRFSGGGRTIEDDHPGLLDAIKNWWLSKSGDEDATLGVAEGLNSALPESLSARGALKKTRQRLRDADAIRD
jgi:hypothetical protein